MNRLAGFLPIAMAGLALASDAAIWKVAPPPPASWQRDRLADLARRRQALIEQIGPAGILILHAAEPRNYAGDVDWPYRQENDYFYLTAIAQPGSTLVLIPDGQSMRQFLFMPPSNPAQETWTGHILTVEEARATSGIGEVWDARLFPAFLEALIPQTKAIFDERSAPPASSRGTPPAPPPIPLDVAHEFAATIQGIANKEIALYMITHGDAAEYGREIEFARKLGAALPGLEVKDAAPLLLKVRAVKSPAEVALLRQAEAITTEAFERAYALAAPGVPEYEIQAQFEFTFTRRNGHWGYPPIIGSGSNATTLHYETNKDTMQAGNLLLMDSAAEFEGYSADVTRTIPVSGKYNKEQAEIYRLVYAAQQAAMAEVLPGHTPIEATKAATKVFGEGLLKLGLITDANNAQQIHVWFNHGIGHGIGLNVHDPSGKEYAPGMAVTIEPGIYIRPGTLDQLPKTPENEKFIAAVRPAFEKYQGIGVRIEDDLLVTKGQPEVLSAAVPSKLEEVEALMARLRKAVRSNPLP